MAHREKERDLSSRFILKHRGHGEIEGAERAGVVGLRHKAQEVLLPTVLPNPNQDRLINAFEIASVTAVSETGFFR